MTGSSVVWQPTTNRNDPHTVIASLYSGVAIQYFPLFLPTEPVKQSIVIQRRKPPSSVIVGVIICVLFAFPLSPSLRACTQAWQSSILFFVLHNVYFVPLMYGLPRRFASSQ
jgi:hypothetical protein